MIKFSTNYEVGELRGSQMAARECYVAMMEMEDQFQALSIEEHRTVTEPVEKLKEITLDSSDPGKPQNPSRTHNLPQGQSRRIRLES